jgi:hypothetical protein
MKRGAKVARQFTANGAALLTAFILLFPNSAAMLCIAPGSHIAIEDINSECCAPDRLAVPVEKQSLNQMVVTSVCGTCTDLFIYSYGREAIPKPCVDAAGMQGVEPSGDQLPADPAILLVRQCFVCNFDTLNSAFSSTPLRC